MTEPRMDEGWYAWREGAQTGPYTWEALYSLTVEGGLAPDDQVWHESLPTWIAARQVPGLFPDQAASVSAATPPDGPAPAAVTSVGGHPASSDTEWPAAPQPVGIEPAIVGPATVEPAGIEPSLAEPSPAEPSAAEPDISDQVAPRLLSPDAPVPGPVEQPAVTPSEAPGRRRTSTPRPPARRRWLVPVIVAAVVVILGGAGAGAYLALRGGGDEVTSASSTTGTSVAAGATTTSTTAAETRPAEAADADPMLVVDTDLYGPGPANQVLVMMAEGYGQEEAETVAAQLGGSVVGHMDYLGLYQIQTAGTTAEDLITAIQAAEALPEVESAAPNGVVTLQEPIVGKKCSPLRDPLYDGDNSRAYDMIGAQQAWDIIRASGVELNNVQVGILDTPVYTESGQGFGTELNFPDAQGNHPEGKIRVKGLAPGDTTDQPDPKSKGGLSHGTQVAHVIGADAEGGGVVGILGMAGDKVSMTTNNAFTQGPTAWQAPNPDPNDVTQYNGYFYRTLVELKKQVDNGATVINLSLGRGEVNANNAWYAAAYKKFFEQMQRDHPDVLFVCAAGNYGGALDGSNYAPGGLKLPNVITVGALDQSGDRADAADWWPEEKLQQWYDSAKAQGKITADTTYEQYVASLKTGSNYATGDGEVTLSACGTGVPTGLDAEGRPVINNGTSFATPQVTAAAALLKAINPELEADDIKQILVDSANSEVEQPDGTKVTVPAGVGGKVLRVDKAVLMAINQMRPANDQLKLEDLVELTTVNLIADGGPEEYTVTASVTKNPKGCDLRIEMMGEGSISGSTSQSLSGPSEATWKVSPKEGYATVKVYRSDTNTCAVIQLEVIDLNGFWEGTLTFTKVELSPELQRQLDEAASQPAEGDLEGCDFSAILAALAELEGKAVPMTMDITALEGGTGTVVLFADFSAIGGESGEPNTLPMTWSGSTLTISEEGSTMTGTATRSGDSFVMNGTLKGTSGEGDETLTISAVWTVTKR